MKNRGLILAVLVILLIGLILLLPSTRRLIIGYDYQIRKIEEESYRNRKTVEDTARSMMAQYESDKLTYEQYKDSDKDNYKELAENAKTRANNTAIKYNEYILKNEYVWKDNVPKDIYRELATIKADE